MIHTADFVLSIHPGRSLRVLFSSAKYARELFEVSLVDIVDMAVGAAEDDIVYARSIRNPATGALETVTRSRVGPPDESIVGV